MTEYPPCPTCGAVADEFLIPVWEDMDDYWGHKDPDYIGCTECHTMHEHGENND